MRGDLDLSTEAVAVDAGRELRRKNLYDDAATEDAVDGHEHATHAATYELAIELLESSTPTRYLTEAYARYAECLERRGRPDAAFAILKKAMAAQVPGAFAAGLACSR